MATRIEIFISAVKDSGSVLVITLWCLLVALSCNYYFLASSVDDGLCLLPRLATSHIACFRVFLHLENHQMLIILSGWEPLPNIWRPKQWLLLNALNFMNEDRVTMSRLVSLLQNCQSNKFEFGNILKEALCEALHWCVVWEMLGIKRGCWSNRL